MGTRLVWAEIVIWVALILYSVGWVLIAPRFLIPLHDKWEEKVEPVIESLIGLIGLWIVKSIMVILLMFLWFIPVMWIIEVFGK